MKMYPWRQSVDPNAILAPFCSQFTGQLGDGCFGEIIRPDHLMCQRLICARVSSVADDSRGVHALVRDSAAHARNHADASRLFQPNNLARRGLGGHKGSCNVDAHHPVDLLWEILKSRSPMIDAGRRDQAIEAPSLTSDPAENIIKFRDVPKVSLMVH